MIINKTGWFKMFVHRNFKSNPFFNRMDHSASEVSPQMLTVTKSWPHPWSAPRIANISSRRQEDLPVSLGPVPKLWPIGDPWPSGYGIETIDRVFQFAEYSNGLVFFGKNCRVNPHMSWENHGKSLGFWWFPVDIPLSQSVEFPGYHCYHQHLLELRLCHVLKNNWEPP